MVTQETRPARVNEAVSGDRVIESATSKTVSLEISKPTKSTFVLRDVLNHLCVSAPVFFVLFLPGVRRFHMMSSHDQHDQ